MWGVPGLSSEADAHWWLSTLLVLSATGVTIAQALGVKAPYGKFVIPKKGEGNGKGVSDTSKPAAPTSLMARLNAWAVDARLAWCVMESPCSIQVVLGLLVLGTAPAVTSFVNRWLLALFTLHYFNRAWVYPFRLSPGTAPVPVFIAFNGWLFCLMNGYLQTRALTHLHRYDPASVGGVEWERDPRFIIGTALFVLGFIGNLQADSILRGLRKPGEPKGVYRIPRGGLYEFVSTANYTAEMVEWIGFAVACWSWSAAAFAIFTCLHLGARAVQNHNWMIEKFGAAYPKNRKKLIPFIY